MGTRFLYLQIPASLGDNHGAIHYKNTGRPRPHI